MSKYVKKITIATLFNYWIYTIIIKIKIGPDLWIKLMSLGFIRRYWKFEIDV